MQSKVNEMQRLSTNCFSPRVFPLWSYLLSAKILLQSVVVVVIIMLPVVIAVVEMGFSFLVFRVGGQFTDWCRQPVKIGDRILKSGCSGSGSGSNQQFEFQAVAEQPRWVKKN